MGGRAFKILVSPCLRASVAYLCFESPRAKIEAT
jgi:hypothetical protein